MFHLITDIYDKSIDLDYQPQPRLPASLFELHWTGPTSLKNSPVGYLYAETTAHEPTGQVHPDPYEKGGANEK